MENAANLERRRFRAGERATILAERPEIGRDLLLPKAALAALSLPEASCSESEFVPGGLVTGVAHGRRQRGRRSINSQGRMAAAPLLSEVGPFPAK